MHDGRSDWITIWSMNEGNPDVRSTLEPKYYAHPLMVSTLKPKYYAHPLMVSTLEPKYYAHPLMVALFNVAIEPHALICMRAGRTIREAPCSRTLTKA